MLVGDAAEIFERAQIVLGDAIAVGIHPAQLPLGHGMAAFSGVLQGVQGRRGRGSRRGRRRSHLLQGLGIQGLGVQRLGGGLGDHGKSGILGLAGAPSNANPGACHRRGP